VTVADGQPAGRGRVYLNGATIMTTPTDQHVRIAREAGYDGVELRAERLLGSPDEITAAAAVVTAREVWSLNGIQIQLTPDGTLDRDRLVAELGPRLEVCRHTKAAYLLVVPPRIVGVASEAAVGPVRDGLSAAADAADASGVRVAFEFLGFADSPIRTPELAAAVVAGVPAADLVLDSCHWHASGAGSLDAFPVERLAMVHLNDAPEKRPELIEDADRVLPGLGVIRLAELVGMLRGRGYRGPWSLETFNPSYWERDPLAVARDGKARLDALLD
jgi:2-keto-myo-inositol isomerase